MKQLIITTIAALLIVGCAKNDITLDGNVHQAEFGYFTPNSATSAIISFEDNGTITPY